MICHSMAVWLGYWFFARRRFPVGLLRVAVSLWLLGVAVDWAAYFGGWL